MASDACSRISNFSERTSGMPVTWNPTVTLLQKKREGLLDSSTPILLDGDADTTRYEGIQMVDGTACHENETKKIEMQQRDSEDKKPIKKTYNASDQNEVNTDAVDQKESEKVIHIQRTVEDDVDDDNSFVNTVEEVEAKRTSEKKEDNQCWSPPDASYKLKRYQNQPMKIENYEPGMSSVLLQDSFVNNFYNPPIEKPGEFCKYIENDPKAKYRIRKINEAPSLSESSVRDVYRKVQKGGDIPIEGLRCPVPPVKVHRYHIKQKEHLRQSSLPPKSSFDITPPAIESIWSSPVIKNGQPHSASIASACISAQSRRTKDELSAARKRELEVAIAEARRRRLIEEAENNKARRHSDYFHAKSPVALDRYDMDDSQFRSGSAPTSPSPHERHLVKARALYTFKAQSSRELSLNKGDTVYILRQIDKNWFEGQRHGTVGIFPVNYVEVLEVCREQSNGEKEGLVIAKFDFEAEYTSELSFQKGDVLRLIREVDSNWYEAMLGHKCGLIPKAYVESLHDRLYVPLTLPLTTSFNGSPQHDSPGTMSSASSGLSGGLDPPVPTSSRHLKYSQGSTTQSMSKSSPHSLEGEIDAKPQQAPDELFQLQTNSLSADESNDTCLNQLSSTEQAELQYRWQDTSEDDLDFQGFRFAERQSAAAALDLPGTYLYYVPESRYGSKHPASGNEFLPYTVCQAVFAYAPQDEDELELLPGDVVYVTEIFDDGWYVGISQRTNTYGTFPGNFVQRLRLHHLQSCTL